MVTAGFSSGMRMGRVRSPGERWWDIVWMYGYNGICVSGENLLSRGVPRLRCGTYPFKARFDAINIQNSSSFPSTS